MCRLSRSKTNLNSCAVTGNTDQLLYWPEATQSEARADRDAPLTVRPYRLSRTCTVLPSCNNIRQMSTLGTVLASPTYYVSYRSVFASDGCSGVGPTLYNIIVPIPGGKQLSSDDLPSSNAADGVAPHAPKFSGSGPNIGDVVAAILRGTEHPDGEETPPSSGLLPADTANLVSEMTLPSSAAGSRGSQASQPAELGQAVGDIIASIAGDAGRLNTFTSVSTHPPQYIPENEWDSAPTPVSVSENRPHRPSHSGMILGSEQANQTPTAQIPAFATSRYPLTSGCVQRSGTSSGLLEDKPPATSDNGSGAIEPMST
jgi:hypothetical protein